MYTRFKKHAVIIVILALLATVGWLAYKYYTELNLIRENPQHFAIKELEKITRAVSRHVVLPENEEPTLATVSDPEKLKDQAFFANAKVGDVVLIYTNARKAILYRPVDDRIIEIAPLNMGGIEKLDEQQN